MVSKFLTAIAATALVAAPVAANAASNAQALSVAKSVRASGQVKGGQKVAGGGLVFALLAAAVVGISIVLVSSDDSDSN